MLRAINLQLDKNVTKTSCGKNLRTFAGPNCWKNPSVDFI